MQADINEMEIADYSILQNLKAAFYRLWKLKLVVFFSTVIGILLSVVYIKYTGESFRYFSSATVYSAVYGSYSETVSGVTLMNTYSSVIGSTRVCERAATEIADPSITASYLKNLVSSGKVFCAGASDSSKSYGYKLDVCTTLESPEYVVIITNAMANAFVSEINELLGEDVIQVFDEATSCFANSSGVSSKLVVALCAAAGFLLSAGLIFIKEFCSSRVFVVSQCENNKDLILGILPYTKVS